LTYRQSNFLIGTAIAVPLAGDAEMGDKDKLQFEDEELETVEDFDDFSDDLDADESEEDPVVVARKRAAKNQADEEKRIKARREIERRNELKALRSELDEWDDLLDEDDL
jgi:hypothetical protein